MMRARLISLMLALPSLMAMAATDRVEELAKRVVVVYNEQEPEGKVLADYYAQKRSVPTNQVFGISVRPVETITRREFNDAIRQPVLQFLSGRGLLKQHAVMVEDPVLGSVPSLTTVQSLVSYIVLMYGVPLRIEPDPSLVESNVAQRLPEALRRNEASVDSELSVMPTMNLPAVGPLPNPFYGNREAQFGPPLNRQMLLVGRLDGPDPKTVRQMIDDALAAEERGLLGRVYLDARGTRDKNYVEGDDWLLNADRLLRKAGFECELDMVPEVFADNHPMADAVIYAGWYAEHLTGPFRREGFRFKPGAFAYHIHSWSATSLRTRQSNWVGPFLVRGVTATMGTVYEPYLGMSPHVDKFFQRWLDGAPFIEAAYYSQPQVSWQTTFVGDPLYRPFASKLDDQITKLERDRSPDVAWAYVRKVNDLIERGLPADAETLCRGKADAWGSPVLFEKLGDLQHAATRDNEAAGSYQKALRSGKDFNNYLRVATKLAGAYEATKQPGLASAVYEGLAAASFDRKLTLRFFEKARDLARQAGYETKVRLLQNKIDELVQAEQPTRPK